MELVDKLVYVICRHSLQCELCSAHGLQTNSLHTPRISRSPIGPITPHHAACHGAGYVDAADNIRIGRTCSYSNLLISVTERSPLYISKYYVR